MEDYKPNSNRFKQEEKAKEHERKVEKVASGKVIARKPSKMRMFTSQIISDDAKNVKSYVFGEVLIPALKKAISDIVRDGIDIILYGESGRSSKRSTADKVSYRNYYDRDTRSARESRSVMPSTTFYNDVYLETRGEAEEVMDRMTELVDSYGVVSIADLKDLTGETIQYTDNKYGWTSMRNARIVRTRDGYHKIEMPRAIPID